MSQASGKGHQNLFARLAIPLLVVVAFVWLMQLGKAPRHLMARRECENRYAQARTAAETLAIDHQQPLVQVRSGAPSGQTCGTLRGARGTR